MALQLSYNSQYGFTAPLAYARIEYFSGRKDDICVQVRYFYNEAAKTNQQPIGSGNFNLTLTYGATMAQMYAALKELPEFVGAVDC